ncbi:MAG TPA: glycosyltransferase family 2 protein [Candidatus Limnocylindria bacterium]|nr:glycosyltransferase family 2 protein [Candidatus Limnocylindria bacterium]
MTDDILPADRRSRVRSPAPGSAPDKPVVSVLIPAWNAEASIGRAIASALEFRDVPLECIVVDDGSSDRTVGIVRDLAAEDPRIVLIALGDNAGVSNARNQGLAVVRGAWLTLVDADDRFLPGGLEMLVRAALASDALAVVGQQVWWDGARRWRAPRYDLPDIRLPGRKSLAGSPGLLNYVSPHAKLFHRSCWDGLEFSGRVLGDQPWIIRALIRAGDRIDVLGETVYEWYRPAPRRGVPSITATTRAQVRGGVEAVEVAGAALRMVREEWQRHRGPAGDDGLLAAYVDRLLVMDLGTHVATALTRADPEIGLLFDAIRRFLGGVPPAHVAATAALTRSILEPPLRRWHRVVGDGRAAYWRLFEASVAIDPALVAHGTSAAVRLALRLAARGPGPANRAAAVLLLRVVRAIRRRIVQSRRTRRYEVAS